MSWGKHALPLVAVLVAAVAVVLASALGDEDRPQVRVAGGDAGRGHELIEDHGCTSCHVIAGFEEPTGQVGPPLEDLDRRRYIAGNEPNTVDVMVRWLMDPQAVEPGTVMPDLGLTARQARDIAAYLYDDG